MDSQTVWKPDFCGERTIYDAFWSNSLSVNSSSPDLTLCFQKTVLLWVPCGWLWLAALPYTLYLTWRPSKHGGCHFSALNLAKMIFGGLLFVNTLVALVLLITSDKESLPVDIMYHTVRCLTMVLATILARVEFIKGKHTSGVAFIYWLLQLLCDVIILRSWVLRRNDYYVDDKQFIAYILYFGLVCCTFILTLFSDRTSLQKHIQGERQPLVKKASEEIEDTFLAKNAMPDLTAPFWKIVTFQWVTGDVIRGYMKPVTFDKLYDLRIFESCRWLLPRFYRRFNKNKEPTVQTRHYGRKSADTNPFFRSLFLSEALPLIIGIVFCVVSLCMRVLQPLILGVLIDFIESDDPLTWKGVLMAFALFVTCFLSAILIHQYLYLAWLTGMRVRTIINSAVYRKALRLSGSAKKETTVGEIINLMSVDAQKIQDAFTYGNLVWEVPVEVVMCTGLIWNTIGPSSIAGLLLLLIVVPLNGFFVADITRKLQAKQMVHKDDRIRNMSEILSGIKIIKLYAWEPSFLKRVLDTRQMELMYLMYSSVVNAISNTFWFLVPYMVSLAVFATYVLISPTNVLDPKMAFVTLSLVNIMNFTLSILPLGVTFLGQAIVSLKRVNKFLELEELVEGTVEVDSRMDDCISIEDGKFSWEANGRIILEKINLNVPRGQLIAVVGHVGSGKSSLISTVLGEMSKQEGRIRINGSIAYVPQQAWIQNATLRDNILFGKNLNNDRYEDLLDACALTPDLQILIGGDMTEIGEKGINLSGGQKQRVSLARAVYQDEDIYLLDDPLSAVDAHVGKHIFDKVIGPNGLLNTKTRVLVTHGISYLRDVDVVVVMRNGTISEVGAYSELIEQNGAFAEFLRNYFNEAEYSSEEEEDILSMREELSNKSAAESDMESGDCEQFKMRRRQISRRNTSVATMKSQQSILEEQKESKLIDDELALEGKVRWRIIGRFIRSGGWNKFTLVLVAQVLFIAAQVLTNFWLSEWSSDRPDANGTMDRELVSLRLGVYGALGVGQGICSAVVLGASALGCVAASRVLHSDLLTRLLHAPTSFFDTTPLGRIMNRLSKDLDIIDTNVPTYLRGWLFCVAPVIATIFVVSYTTPVFLAAIIPIGIIYLLAQQVYIQYVRQLKRLDTIRRSPIYAHFDETICGTTSIRAYGRQGAFTRKCDRLVDDSQKPFYMILVAQRWLGVSMETLGGVVTFLAALFAVLQRDNLTGGMAGLSISYALSITVFMNSFIRCSTEMETYMVSVERVDEYCSIEQEKAWEVESTQTAEDWPQEGRITWDHYATRYRPGLDLVLSDLTCDISAGEKVGIVGRTGAGKSSLALALFRIIEAANGSIVIDGVPIASLGLHNLRSRLTVIPQDPVIFSGSLRVNLDPFGQYSDQEIWPAIERAHLKSFVETLDEGLDYECGEGGEALSVGQRQLVCLARALLRQTKVLVLDEATAAVDLETDALIQTTIRAQFADATVLTIAHRLATVLDYDRIMVLDKGTVLEFDTPKNLLSKRDSVFYSLAKEAGVL